MKMYFTVSSGTPAATSWRLTPIPQSITKGVSFTTTRFAGFERPSPTRGPPFVPRKTMRVRGFAACANAAGAVSAAAAESPSFNTSRRSTITPLPGFSFDARLARAKHTVENGQTEDHRERNQDVTDRAEQGIARAAE